MTSTRKIIAAIVIVAVLMLGIGYAAITNITLDIQGNATAVGNQANFVVGFTGTPTTKITTAVTPTGVTPEASATIDGNDETQATINVTNLTAKGDTVVAIYTVKNSSADLAAELSTSTTSTNTDYTVISKLDKNYIKPNEVATVTVTIVLDKTPINANITEAIGVKVEAKPIQQSEVPAQ